MRHLCRLFVAILFLSIASVSQASTITAPILDTQADDLWAYSRSDAGSSDPHNFWYTSLGSLPGDMTFLGYVSGDYHYDTFGANWPDSFIGTNSNGSDTTSTHLFETYILSNIDQTVQIGASGDDGHSIFIDDAFIVGDGFSDYVSTSFVMTAGTQYKVSFVLNNSGGGWHVNYGLGFADEAHSYINPIGDFSASSSDPVPTPEPSTFILLGAGLVGLLGLGRKRMRA